jgi:hypothetical protein
MRTSIALLHTPNIRNFVLPTHDIKSSCKQTANPCCKKRSAAKTRNVAEQKRCREKACCCKQKCKQTENAREMQTELRCTTLQIANFARMRHVTRNRNKHCKLRTSLAQDIVVHHISDACYAADCELNAFRFTVVHHISDACKPQIANSTHFDSQFQPQKSRFSQLNESTHSFHVMVDELFHDCVFAIHRVRIGLPSSRHAPMRGGAFRTHGATNLGKTMGLNPQCHN